MTLHFPKDVEAAILATSRRNFLRGSGALVFSFLATLYPAWKAARLVPMDAIRVGSH